MKFRDFEDFLMWEFHKTEGRHCLDDDIPDAFDWWLEQTDLQDLIDYGQKYGEYCKKEVQNDSECRISNPRPSD